MDVVSSAPTVNPAERDFSSLPEKTQGLLRSLGTGFPKTFQRVERELVAALLQEQKDPSASQRSVLRQVLCEMAEEAGLSVVPHRAKRILDKANEQAPRTRPESPEAQDLGGQHRDTDAVQPKMQRPQLRKPRAVFLANFSQLPPQAFVQALFDQAVLRHIEEWVQKTKGHALIRFWEHWRELDRQSGENADASKLFHVLSKRADAYHFKSLGLCPLTQDEHERGQLARIISYLPDEKFKGYLDRAFRSAQSLHSGYFPVLFHKSAFEQRAARIPLELFIIACDKTEFEDEAVFATQAIQDRVREACTSTPKDFLNALNTAEKHGEVSPRLKDLGKTLSKEIQSREILSGEVSSPPHEAQESHWDKQIDPPLKQILTQVPPLEDGNGLASTCAQFRELYSLLVNSKEMEAAVSNLKKGREKERNEEQIRSLSERSLAIYKKFFSAMESILHTRAGFRLVLAIALEPDESVEKRHARLLLNALIVSAGSPRHQAHPEITSYYQLIPSELWEWFKDPGNSVQDNSGSR